MRNLVDKLTFKEAVYGYLRAGDKAWTEMGKSLDEMFVQLNGKRLLLDFAWWADKTYSTHRPERRLLRKLKGRWGVKPAGAAFWINLNSWNDAVVIITLPEADWLGWYGQNLMY